MNKTNYPSEYCGKRCACFKPDAPMCPVEAVIPTITVETKEDLRGIANCLVHVADINTTYYIDNRGRIIQTWAGPLVIDNYDYETNPLELRDQMVYDFANDIVIVYNKSGDYKIFCNKNVEELIEEHNNDPEAHPYILNRLTIAEGDIVGLGADIDDINEVIPTQASVANKLADKDFVNSSINSITAFYITKNAAGDQFDTKAELDSTTVFYSGGEVRVPTKNDYCIVLEDESKTDPITGENPTTRYIYQNGNWEFQYIVNKTALTAAQLAAINSGITSTIVDKVNTLADIRTIGDGLALTSGTLSASVKDVQVAGTSVISNKVANIPIATGGVLGVVKANPDNGLQVFSDGALAGYTQSYSSYIDSTNALVVNKGTLENVFTGKGVVTSQEATKLKVLTQAEYDALATKDANTLYFVKEV